MGNVVCVAKIYLNLNLNLNLNLFNADFSNCYGLNGEKTDFFKKIKIFHFLYVHCEATQACIIKNLVSIVALDEFLQTRSND